jgi:hypothetical protein
LRGREREWRWGERGGVFGEREGEEFKRKTAAPEKQKPKTKTKQRTTFAF